MSTGRVGVPTGWMGCLLKEYDDHKGDCEISKGIV